MRRRAGFLAVLGLSVLLVACSGGGTTSQTTTTTATIPSTTQLKARLLAVGDVGAGWKAGQAITPEDLAAFSQIPCPDSAINPTIATRLTAVTGIQFDPTSHSYRHLIELAVTGDPKRLHTDLQALIDAMDSCSTTTSTTTDTTKLTVRKFTIPELGDQRAAYVMTDTESPGSPATFYVRNAAVRVGSVAIGVGLTEVLARPQDEPQLSDETFVQIVKAAVAKLK